MELEHGSRLGHYQIGDRLGKGGMGEVYRARDTRLNRDVALKVLPASVAQDPDRRMRFEREAQAVAALNHPNIITIHSVEHDGETHFITMELIEGKTLGQLIPGGGLPLDRMFEIAVPLADALAAAHQKGITHRDLKPENVMVTGDGRVKVLDFGLAKPTDVGSPDGTHAATATQTAEGKILGTAAYMSPEQAEGKPVDARSDVFSLGIVLYEMASGNRPFDGDTRISTITSIMRDKPPSLSDVRASLPRHLSRIVNHCLAKEPDRRYQSALDVRNELDELRREIDSGELEPDVAARIPARPQPRRVGPVAGAIAAIAAVAVLALGAWWMMRGGGSDPTAASVSAGRSGPVAVLGFENLADPDDTEQLGRMLSGLITTGLAESRSIDVVSSAKVLTSLKRAGSPDGRFDPSLAAEAAELAGAGSMLTGQLMQTGERMLLTAELVDVGSGNTLGSMRAEGADRSELFALAGGIAAQVRERLGEGQLAEGLAIDLAQSLTDSPEAYRLYASGEMALHERRFTEAIEHLTQAVRRDPTFALAYYQLGMAQLWHGDRGGALRNLHTGLPHIERLPATWQTTYRAVIDYEAGTVDSAYDALDALVAEEPSIPDPYNYLGEILTHYNKYEDWHRAKELFHRALEIDPTYKVVLFHLIDHLLYADEAERAREVVERYRDDRDPSVLESRIDLLFYERRFEDVVALERDPLFADVARDHFALWSSLVRTGNADRAIELASRGVDESVGYSQGLEYWSRAFLFVEIGRFRAALDDLEAGPPLFDSPVVQALGALIHTTHANLLELVGDPDGAVNAARAARQMDYFSYRGRFELVRLLQLAGRGEEALRELANFETMAADSRSPGADCWLELARAARIGAAGNPRAALEALEASTNASCAISSRPVRTALLARNEERAGNLKRALRHYRTLADPPWPPGNILYGWESEALYHVARLEQATGDTRAAREHFREFLTRWGDPDMPIPIVDDARARLAALGG